mmetsp:Transcript_21252/g.54504  ORF Transcript_21252/g.54504 Transcript_21252/m.54504 type:complete len:211 (+) Transcript_21252:969-1601(+)
MMSSFSASTERPKNFHSTADCEVERRACASSVVTMPVLTASSTSDITPPDNKFRRIIIACVLLKSKQMLLSASMPTMWTATLPVRLAHMYIEKLFPAAIMPDSKRVAMLMSSVDRPCASRSAMIPWCVCSELQMSENTSRPSSSPGQRRPPPGAGTRQMGSAGVRPLRSLAVMTVPYSRFSTMLDSFTQAWRRSFFRSHCNVLCCSREDQ